MKIENYSRSANSGDNDDGDNDDDDDDDDYDDDNEDDNYDDKNNEDDDSSFFKKRNIVHPISVSEYSSKILNSTIQAVTFINLYSEFNCI